MRAHTVTLTSHVEFLAGNNILINQVFSSSDLHIKYETACDPRLNHEQSIELAFTVADLIKNNKKD